jgi:hypothetical protein
MSHHLESDSIDKAPTRRRRWLRFSVRTFFITTTGVCLWFGIVYNRVQREQRAAAAIEAASGNITYDWQIRPEDGDPNERLTPPGPTWLRERLGRHWFDKIVRIHLHDDDSDPSRRFKIVGSHLVRLPNLRSLNPTGEQRTQEEYQLLGQLSIVRKINVVFRSAKERGNATFAERKATINSRTMLTQRETLGLSQGSGFERQHLAALVQAKNLCEIRLDGPVPPEAVGELAGLQKLSTLEVKCRLRNDT